MKTKGLLTTVIGLALGTGLTVTAWAAPAVVEKGTVDLGEVTTSSDDMPEIVSECFGQRIQEVVHVVYNYHMVQRPNGTYAYHDLYFHFTGMITGDGTVWTLQNNVSPYIERSNGDGLSHYSVWSTWVSETGPTIKLRFMFHANIGADGELLIKWDTSECWVKD